MSRLVAWSVHLSFLAAGVTGCVYGYMRLWLEPADEFSILNHPHEPLWRATHIVLSPLLLFTCGLIWRSHVWTRIVSGWEERRWTGLALFALLLPMGLSGYLLQVSEQESLRAIWSWTHAITGAAWVLAYAAHLLQRD